MIQQSWNFYPDEYLLESTKPKCPLTELFPFWTLDNCLKIVNEGSEFRLYTVLTQSLIYFSLSFAVTVLTLKIFLYLSKR